MSIATRRRYGLPRQRCTGRPADTGCAPTSIFAGTLVLAGVFTLVPGRIMHAVTFGG
jgi:hypothetical protein